MIIRPGGCVATKSRNHEITKKTVWVFVFSWFRVFVLLTPLAAIPHAQTPT